MKTEIISNADLPGKIYIEATTPAEILFLRQFCKDDRPIRITIYGGNIAEGSFSMTIGHSKKENDE